MALATAAAENGLLLMLFTCAWVAGLEGSRGVRATAPDMQGKTVEQHKLVYMLAVMQLEPLRGAKPCTLNRGAPEQMAHGCCTGAHRACSRGATRPRRYPRC